MSSVLHPVGPERRTTYWKRRLVVVLVLLALLVAVVLLVRGLGSGGDPQPSGQGVIDPSGVAATVTGTPSAPASPTTSPTGSPTTSPTTSPTASPSSGGACGTSQLKVTTSTDASVYGPNVNPQLKVVVENTAAAGCDVRVGAGTRTLVVRDAGGASVWSSADCSPSAAATTVGLLAAGQRAGTASDTTAMTQTWSLERSAPGCPTGLPAVEAGTYTLTGTWGDVTLPATSFTITPR